MFEMVPVRPETTLFEGLGFPVDGFVCSAAPDELSVIPLPELQTIFGELPVQAPNAAVWVNTARKAVDHNSLDARKTVVCIAVFMKSPPGFTSRNTLPFRKATKPEIFGHFSQKK
jgi:hypothetical protein